MKDALGFEMEIGKLYGYSNRTNGWVKVVIGICTKINESSVTLQVIKRGSTIYNDNIKQEDLKRRSTINPNSNSLFPLQNSNTNWELENA